MYDVELTLDHTLARRGALMLIPRANLRWPMQCGMPMLGQRSECGQSTLGPRGPNISLLFGCTLGRAHEFGSSW